MERRRPFRQTRNSAGSEPNAARSVGVCLEFGSLRIPGASLLRLPLRTLRLERPRLKTVEWAVNMSLRAFHLRVTGYHIHAKMLDMTAVLS
jgi:hypothetical protein